MKIVDFIILIYFLFICYGAEVNGAFQLIANGNFEEPWCALEITVKPTSNIL